jgi:hypothetical protein
MSYKTSFWEEGIDWNGVVYPVTAQEIKPSPRKFDISDIAINLADKDMLNGDVRCDIPNHVVRSKNAMGQAIKDIDKIREIEVRWKLFLCLWTVTLLVVFGLAYVLNAVVRLPRKTAVGLSVFLIVACTLAYAFITFIQFYEENIDDAKKLTELYNKVRTERDSQLNYIRLSNKLR